MCLLQLLGVRQQPKLMDSLICTNENQLIMLPYEPPKPCKDATPYGSIRSIGTIFSKKKKNVINKNISNINHEMLRIQILTLSIELYIDTHYLLGQVFFYFFSLTKTQVARERERESEPFGYLEKLLALMMPTRCTQSNSQHPHLLIP